MEEITTASGKKFYTDYLVTIPKPKTLYVRILEAARETVNDVFRNPEETKVLTCREQQYTGFTDCKSIISEGDALKVRLENAIDNNS